MSRPSARDLLGYVPEQKTKRVDLFRRKFLAGAGLAGAAMALGSGSTGLVPRASANLASPFSDADILNFALNLEYLEAEFYLHATTGSGLANNEITGVGTLGPVNGGAQVPFAIPAIQQYANQIANDEHNHVLDLRAALGNAAVARPHINIQHAFTQAAVAAGIIQQGQTFQPYANDENFVLAAFVFEDVGVTAYHGAAPLIADANTLSAAAGILAVEAYHAGSIRTVLNQLGQTTPSLITAANAISNLRAMADGMGTTGHETPLTDNSGNAFVVAEDLTTSLAFGRTFKEVLRIVYLGGHPGVGGGFFPAGLNGTIF